jgi:serine protease Do
MQSWFQKNILTTSLIFAFTTPAAFSYTIPPSKKLVDSEDVNILHRISGAVSAIANEANKAVVFVSVSKTVKGGPADFINPFEFFFGPGFQNPRQPQQDRRQEGLGSGFFIDLDKGYILTNNHVVADADEITVRLSNGQNLSAKVVGKDKNTDVAVVQIKDNKYDRKGLGALTLGESDQLRVGDFVVALGAPFGLEASLSFGVVSALGRGSLSITELGDFIQTDAAINPGNSGGPLLNTYGEVIGVNTAIYSRTGAYNGIGFAIPANLVRTVAEQLIKDGKVERGYLGVGLNRGLDPELAKDMGLPDGTTGALVSAVEPNGPAKKAGLEPGDVVIELNGRPVINDVELRNRIGLMRPGTKADLKVFRNGKSTSIAATLTNWPDRSEAEILSESVGQAPFGLSVAPVNSSTRKQFNLGVNHGVVVTAVEPNSASERSGLQPGDVIIRVNRDEVRAVADFDRAMKGKSRVQLRIIRDKRELFIPLRK